MQSPSDGSSKRWKPFRSNSRFVSDAHDWLSPVSSILLKWIIQFSTGRSLGFCADAVLACSTAGRDTAANRAAPAPWVWVYYFHLTDKSIETGKMPGLLGWASLFGSSSHSGDKERWNSKMVTFRWIPHDVATIRIRKHWLGLCCSSSSLSIWIPPVCLSTHSGSAAANQYRYYADE